MRHFNHVKNLGPLLLLPLLFGCNSSTNSNTNGATVPDAPTNVTGLPGNARVTVAWILLSSGGSAITGYKATAVQDTSKHCVSGAATSCVVTGLTNNVPYTFTVTATNAAGTSIPSFPSTPVIPLASIISPPSEPMNVTGLAGYTNVTVSWTEPTSNGGSSITSYTAFSVQDATKYCTSVSETSCVVTGLTNGTSYSFFVTATNVSGTGPASSHSALVTPGISVPDAPIDVLGTESNSQITVSWSVPISNGGTDITGYRATSVEDTSKFCITTSSTSCVVTGLTKGYYYSFAVTATNAKGTSVASSPSYPVMVPTFPSAPRTVTGEPGTSKVTVSWAAPASNGGSAIIGYKVVAMQDTSKYCTTTSATSCLITGLTNDTPYTFTVTAINALGTSPASTSTPVTPIYGASWTLRNSGISGGKDLYSVAWTGSLFVAVGSAGNLMTSSNGISWTPNQLFGSPLWSVIWTGSQIIVVGANGTIVTSPNGTTWTSRSTQTANALYSVTWAGNQLVAVGGGSGGISTILTSPDGVTWTPQVSGTSNGLTDVIWAGNQLVALGSSGTILTSPNGVTWTSRNSGTTTGLSSVAWTGNRLVVMGSGIVLISSDGVVWSRQTSDLPLLFSATWSGTQLVAVGNSGIVLTSPDGLTWTERTSAAYEHLYSVIKAGTQLVAVGLGGVIVTSP